MATELKILTLAFRPLSDQDDEDDAAPDTAAETLDPEDDDDGDDATPDAPVKEDDEPDIEQ